MLRSVAAGAFALALASLCHAHEPGEEEPAPPRTGPVLVERAAPDYPEAARRAGISGTVSLELTVGEDGATAAVKVLRGAGFGFDEAAVAAARRFKWKPATDHGRPIASTVLFDQVFTLKQHFTAEVSGEPAAPPAAPAAPSSERYQTTVADRAPTSAASSSTVRNLDFDLRPKSSPNDLLRVVPGLLAVQHQGGGKADQLFLRGFDADHGTDVGVFVDGVPVNLPSHAHGQGYADLHWIIPEAIERIDVAKGPYDVRWGDFSTAGAVNLVTRDHFDENSVQLTIDSFPTERGFGGLRFVGVAAPHFTGAAEKLHAWAAFEAAEDDGPFVAPERLRRGNLFAKLAWDLTPSTEIGAFVQAYGSQWVGSGQLPEREVAAGRLARFGSLDPSEGGSTDREMATLFLRHKDADDELVATLYVTRYRLALWNDFTFFLRDPVNGDEIEQDDARVLGGLRVDYHFHRRWRGISLRSTLGAEARVDGIHVDLWDAESQDGDFRKRLAHRGDDDVSQANVAAYAEEDVVFNKYVRAIAGLRADYFAFAVSDANEALGAGQPNTSGTAQRALLSPKASAVVTPLPGTLDLYLNFGMGFHSNPAQVALADGSTRSDASGNRFTVHAVPRIYGGEVGARLRLWSRLDVAAAVWASWLENETVFDADAGAFVPSDATRRIGVDVEARVRILPWLFADLDLAQASATAVPDGGNGGAVALAPRIYLTGGVTVKHPIGVRAGVRFRYLGERPAFDEASAEYQQYAATDPARVTAQGYFIVDAYAAYRWRFVEAALSAQNLLNSDWREAQFGARSCTFAETHDPMNVHCALGQPARDGVVDVHFTPGVPFNLQATVKLFF